MSQMTDIAATQRSSMNRWKSALAALAQAVAAGRFSPGEMAVLRRLHPEDPAGPVFWNALIHYVDPYVTMPERDPARRDAEWRWALIMGQMAKLTHREGENPGNTLADTGFSDQRFERLLRASGKSLARELRSAVAFLVSKGRAVDWVQLGELILSDSGQDEWAEDVRRRLARAFHRSRFSKDA